LDARWAIATLLVEEILHAFVAPLRATFAGCFQRLSPANRAFYAAPQLRMAQKTDILSRL
jgi:hypothetical protein